MYLRRYNSTAPSTKEYATVIPQEYFQFQIEHFSSAFNLKKKKIDYSIKFMKNNRKLNKSEND